MKYKGGVLSWSRDQGGLVVLRHYSLLLMAGMTLFVQHAHADVAPPPYVTQGPQPAKLLFIAIVSAIAARLLMLFLRSWWRKQPPTSISRSEVSEEEEVEQLP